ncbi:pilus assembly protein N-terminal domain-containing protein [Pelagibacterium montanilacus]|uniref:pilus assembly protein N-terminal domain-containing protein n=1 Tax=Pelagibacterium montanilacus TaxID=2185280 RepID=UPI000F8E683E|nr:pilus assembly protein N-terminal domain-containing protein [Pelagibacterium montanilacus]
MARYLSSVALATLLAFGAGAAVTGAGAVEAGSVVSVDANMARVLRISAPAATVIIGNPGVADVTIQDPRTLVLTGKSFGRTNLIVLDAAGDPIADTIVEVTQVKSDTLTVFMGDRRTSMACAPTCQRTITLGDDTTYTSDVMVSSDLVDAAAQ